MKKFLLILPLVTLLGVGCEKKSTSIGTTPGTGTGTAKIAPPLENPSDGTKTPPKDSPSTPMTPPNTEAPMSKDTPPQGDAKKPTDPPAGAGDMPKPISPPPPAPAPK